MPSIVSIIIPALDEEKIISGTIESLRGVRGDFEIVVVDGGGLDRTVEIAAYSLKQFPRSHIVRSARGRGQQLNEGVRRAAGDALLFLHADTILPTDAIELINKAMEDPRVAGGNFKVSFDGKDFSSKIFNRIYSARRWFGIYYGDSAMWVRRDVFERIGGFINAPVMEDYEFCRRLERAGRTVCLSSPVITSSRRWAGGGTLATIFVWALMQWLYILGVSPHRLARLYSRKNSGFRRRHFRMAKR